MTDETISHARANLAAIVDAAKSEPVYLTRHARPVAAVVDAAFLERLLEDAEELADIRAVDEAWAETDRLQEAPVPWEQVKQDLGLA